MIAFVATLAIVLALALMLVRKRNGELRTARVQLHVWKLRALNAESHQESLRKLLDESVKRFAVIDEELAYLSGRLAPKYVPFNVNQHPTAPHHRDFDPNVIRAAQARVNGTKENA